MQKYANTNNITKTIYDYPVCSYCTIGKDFYTGEFHIEIEMSEHFVDYNEVRNFLEYELNGVHATAEELLGKVFEKILELYAPKGVYIEYKFHTPLPTKIIKEWRANEE
jgi:hypothetical protein